MGARGRQTRGAKAITNSGCSEESIPGWNLQQRVHFAERRILDVGTLRSMAEAYWPTHDGKGASPADVAVFLAHFWVGPVDGLWHLKQPGQLGSAIQQTNVRPRPIDSRKTARTLN